MKKTLLLFLYLFVLQISNAHILIKGKVIDANTQLPIAGAIIHYSGKEITTDILGTFLIETDSTIHQIEVNASYYEEKSISLPQSLPELLMIYLDPTEVYQLADVIIENQEINALHTLSKVDLNARNVNTSQDLLRLVPGLFLAQHAGGGKAEQIFLRGYDIDHGTDINISVDGMPVNMVSHAHGQGYADMHFVIPELVQNIDYGKGPYNAEVGNMGTAGYAKLKTVDVLSKSRVSLEAGQFNTLRNVNAIDLLNTAQKGLNKSAFIASEVFTSNGPFQSSQAFNRINLMSKYTTQTDNSFLSIQASYFSSKWDASGQVPERAVSSGLISRFGAIDNTEGGITGRKSLIISYKYKPSASSVLDNTLYLSNYDFKLFSNFTFFLRDSINGDQIMQKENRNLVGYNGSYTHTKTLGDFVWKQKYGLGIRYDKIEGIALSYTTQRRFLSNVALGDIFELDHSVYTDQQLCLGKFVLNAGLRINRIRWEYHNTLDTLYQPFAAQKAVILPKLNLLYNATNTLQVYLKTGKGFHSNDTRTIVQEKGLGMLPAVYGTDLGLTAKVSKKLWFNTALWYLFSEQEFVYVGDEGIVEAGGRTARKGIDLSGRYQLLPWLLADLDLTLTKPRSLDVPKEEAYVPLAPTYTASGGLSFNFKNGINGNLRFRHLGDRPANETNSVQAKGYTVVDASIYYTQTKFELGLIAQNLFNVAWNEAQFDTESRLKNEASPVSELHYTPGTPFFAKLKASYFF